MMSDFELTQYLEDCINAGLDTNAESSSLTNAFKIFVNQSEGYFDFVPVFPGPFRLTKELSDKIQIIVSGAVFPYLTMLGYSSVNLVDLTSRMDNIHTARGLRFYFLNGGSDRLQIDDLESDLLTDDYKIILQENLEITPNQNPALAINGKSGSGKSILGNIILSGLRQYIYSQSWDWDYDFMCSDNAEVRDLFGGKLINIVDPKLDLTTYFFAQNHDDQINYYSMSDQVSNAEFLNMINSKESDFLKVMHFRQKQRLKNPDLKFAPLILSIDEVQFATSAVSKPNLNTFQSLTDRIILTARSSNGFLMLMSQSFPIPGSISSASRDGLSYKFVLSSHPSKQDTRFLMKDFEPETIAMNPDEYSFGNGIFEDNTGLIRSFKAPLVRSLF